MNKTYKGQVTKLKQNQFFVFGSNTQGRHGKGSALIAKQKFGAIYGQAEGFQGQSYAIITKDISSMPHSGIAILDITTAISQLYYKAKEMPESEFLIAYSGTGTNLNGYTPKQMAYMFAQTEIPENIIFEEEFYQLILGVYEAQEKLRNLFKKKDE